MKKKFKFILVASLLFGVSGFNSAKAITADELLGFMQAYAASVQENFDLVIQIFGEHETRLSDGDARIAALESDLAANASLISSMQTQIDQLQMQNAGFDSGDLTGSIYCFINVGSELTGSSAGFSPGVYTSHSQGALMFTSATQLSILDGGGADAFLFTNTGLLDAENYPVGTINIYSYSLTGNIVTIFGKGAEGGDMFLFLTPDANLLLSDETSLQDGGANHGANMMIAVRGDSC